MRRQWLYIWVTLAFSASMCLARHLGVSFTGNGFSFFWQYLDIVLLRDDLLRSLWNLHSQPPLFNAFLGVALKLFPDSSLVAEGVAFWATGLGLLLGMAWIMRKCGTWDGLNALVCTIFALNPAFMVYTNWLFYTLPTAALLLAAGAFLVKYRDVGREAWAHAFSWGCVAAILTRSTYHPIWFVTVLMAAVRLVPAGLRRRLLLAAILPFLVANAWYAKNLVQVGMYTSSSWIGMNLAHSWQVPQEDIDALIRSGTLPAAWAEGGFQRPDAYISMGFFDPSDLSGLHPADGAPYKSNGDPNYNNRAYAAISKAMLRGDIALIEAYPADYLRRVADAAMLYIQPGPNSTHFLVKYDSTKVIRLKDATTRLFFGGKPYLAYGGARPAPNMLVVGYPALLIYGAWVALRRIGDVEGRDGSARIFMAYAVLTALWGAACSIGIEVGENDRMRWETDPLIAIVGAHLVQTTVVWVRSRAGRRARSHLEA